MGKEKADRDIDLFVIVIWDWLPDLFYVVDVVVGSS